MAVVTVTVVIVALDTTVLNVAIPTILRDFDTTLPSLQWVITGYALTFASLLIIGGRLGDIFGHRRVFVIGAALFGCGSLIAALSQNVLQLVIGEAVIEGIGASLMMPATLAILSNSFVGQERATAFGIWGTVGGASGALGPVVGGLLTSNFSWRWAFGINVIITPLAIAGAMLFMPRVRGAERREPLDVQGALLIAAGMFLLVFGLTEGSVYGWVRPLKQFTIAGARAWPPDAPVSVVVVAFALAIVLLGGFYGVERRKERRRGAPLFEFGELRNRGFRYGLIVTLVMSLGQFGLSFVLPIFLQEGRRLSAEENGLWQLPIGLTVLVGAQLGSRLSRRIGILRVVRLGILCAAAAFTYIAFSLTADVTFLRLLPGMVLYGLGFGLALAQLTNIVLSDVDRSRSGAAGGASTTARQIGFSVGIAIIGSLLSARTIANAVSRVQASPALGSATKRDAIDLIQRAGVSFRPPPGTSPGDVGVLRRLFVDALAIGARVPLLFAAATLALSLAISLLLPHPHLVPLAPEDELLAEVEIVV